MVVKKRHTTFFLFFSFRQVLEKNDLVTNNLLTSSFGWTLYQVASDPRHSTKNLNEHLKKKNVLKCKLGSFTCPSTRIRIVHFTVFVCENQVSALPLQFLVVPSLKNKRFALPAAI